MENKKIENEMNGEKASFGSKVKSFFAGIGAFFKKLFSKKEKNVTENTKQKKKMSKKGKIVLFSILGAVVVALLLVYFLGIHPILFNQSQMFDKIGDTVLNPSKQPQQSAVPGEEEIDPYENVLSQADLDMMKDTVNVLIIGADYAPERETWSGKHAYHADVMMVLAINFEENTVDMISIPRDTYAKIPGVDGIYKINASLDCGGGIPDGFEKVCETAEWMLGGIPVDYYFAVTMPAVKELVNAMGGVTYNVEEPFQMAGRRYQAGEQYMDGQAVLDYLRVRKGIKSAGDQNRINRQKKMLIALFKEMQNEDTILKIPEIWAAVSEGTYTNMNTSQIMSLAAFAYKLDADNIGMHSMGGSGRSIFNWNFVLTNQKKRVEIIKEVYGIDVKQYSDYSLAGATKRWAGMKKDKDIDVAGGFLSKIKPDFEADALITPSPEPTTPPPSNAPTAPPATMPPVVTAPPATPTPVVTQAPTPEPASDPEGISLFGVKNAPTNSASKVYGRKYTDMQHYQYTQATQLLRQLKDTSDPETVLSICQELEAVCDSLAVSLGQKPLKWKIDYETTTNEIYVDFR